MYISLRDDNQKIRMIDYVKNIAFKDNKIIVTHYPNDYEKVCSDLNTNGYKTVIIENCYLLTKLNIEDICAIDDHEETIFKIPTTFENGEKGYKGYPFKMMRANNDKIAFVHLTKKTREWFDKVYRNPDDPIDPNHKMQLINNNVVQVIDKPKEFIITGNLCENIAECYKITESLLNKTDN